MARLRDLSEGDDRYFADRYARQGSRPPSPPPDVPPPQPDVLPPQPAAPPPPDPAGAPPPGFAQVEPEPEPEPEPPLNSFLHADLLRDTFDPTDLTRDQREIEWSLKLGDSISNATLENSRMDPSDIERLRNPPQHTPTLDDPDERYSIEIFLAVTDGSESVYEAIRAANRIRFPELQMLSYWQVKKRVRVRSGVVEIYDDCCINSCHAFTGFLIDEPRCQICGKERWHPQKSTNGKKVPRQQSVTTLLGPQLAARRLHPESARAMNHQAGRSRRIVEDFARDGPTSVELIDSSDMGQCLLSLIRAGRIKPTDSILLWCTDGAQLYQSKASDCWISIWVILSVSEDLRYLKKYVLPSGTIPGPNKPQNLDTYNYTAFHHLSAIQKEGLRVWDASTGQIIDDHPFLACIGADTPGMAAVDGMVGHSGRVGCRFSCGMVGRHKQNSPIYFPVALKPNNYHMAGCDHGDVDVGNLVQAKPDDLEKMCVYLLAYASAARSTVASRFAAVRLRTGICKPTIVSGLPRSHRLGVPTIFVADLMHLVCLNLTDLLLGLVCGTIDCDPKDSKDEVSWPWFVLKPPELKVHGAQVGDCSHYVPGDFDVACRDLAKKMNSGYKAKEFLNYFFGYFAPLLRQRLPPLYFKILCKAIAGLVIVYAKSFSSEDLRYAHKLLVEFENEFEQHFYKRMPERIHFVRQAIHQLPHLAWLSYLIGPLALVAQWTQERLIGDLGREIKQPSRPFANLAQRAVRRAQVNALQAIYPDLGNAEKPSNSYPIHDLGSGYTLLHPVDTASRGVTQHESNLITAYWRAHGGTPFNGTITSVRRWGRLRLPGIRGQEVHTAWKENVIPWDQLRISRCVRVSTSYHYLDIELMSLRFLVVHPKTETSKWPKCAIFSASCCIRRCQGVQKSRIA
ncbi:hypothetical protein PENSPDRAFT_573224 [Peniophora sp. CONT]|nr:hypothetical protein PENSPDRAFT_573224 [Peniophora sp. CONT]